jgi:hypothetical protein
VISGESTSIAESAGEFTTNISVNIMALVILHVKVVDVPRLYGHLLKEWKKVEDRRKREFYRRWKDIFEWVRYNVTHAEVFNFIGIPVAERQPCPFHKSDTGTSFQVIMGNQAGGRTVKEYPRFICMNTECIAHKSWDTIEFLYQLYVPRLDRTQLAIILFTANQTGLLVDGELGSRTRQP